MDAGDPTAKPLQTLHLLLKGIFQVAYCPNENGRAGHYLKTSAISQIKQRAACQLLNRD